jgi:hypothetical protein
MLVWSMEWSRPNDVHMRSGKQLDESDIMLGDMQAKQMYVGGERYDLLKASEGCLRRYFEQLFPHRARGSGTIRRVRTSSRFMDSDAAGSCESIRKGMLIVEFGLEYSYRLAERFDRDQEIYIQF